MEEAKGPTPALSTSLQSLKLAVERIRISEQTLICLTWLIIAKSLRCSVHTAHPSPYTSLLWAQRRALIAIVTYLSWITKLVWASPCYL